jgi:hypothetical protein
MLLRPNGLQPAGRKPQDTLASIVANRVAAVIQLPWRVGYKPATDRTAAQHPRFLLIQPPVLPSSVLLAEVPTPRVVASSDALPRVSPSKIPISDGGGSRAPSASETTRNRKREDHTMHASGSRARDHAYVCDLTLDFFDLTRSRRARRRRMTSRRRCRG